MGSAGRGFKVGASTNPDPSGNGVVTVTSGRQNLASTEGTNGQVMEWDAGAKFVTVGGDISGPIDNVTVNKVGGATVSGTLASGKLLIASSSSAATWQPVGGDAAMTFAGVVTVSKINNSLCTSAQIIENTGSALACVTVGGDATISTGGSLVNTKVNGTTVPAGGSLTTGNVLQVSGASADTYGPVNLAGGANYVTGALPDGNQAAQTMGGDVSGTTAAATVAKINGSACTSAQIIENTGSALACVTVGGDETIATSGSVTNTKLQGINWSASTPAQGNVPYASSASQWSFLAVGTAGQVLQTQGASANPQWITAIDNSTDGFRLTLTTATPITTSDVTGAGTLYLTPYRTNYIALYTSSVWNILSSAEVNLSLTLTSGKNYDVFAYSSSGTLTLVLSSAWTSDTARNDALAQQDGVWVLGSDHSRRWVGTIRASGTNTAEDSLAKRFVWNTFNQVTRNMFKTDSTANWNYSSATIEQTRGTATNQLDYVTGDIGTVVTANAASLCLSNSSAAACFSDIGVDGVAANETEGGYVATTSTTTSYYTKSRYVGYPGLGRHFLTWCERGNGTGTVTWDGTGTANVYPGISGILSN